jgi:hypothetical protein
MSVENRTTVAVSEETWREINKSKSAPSETVDDVLRRKLGIDEADE